MNAINTTLSAALLRLKSEFPKQLERLLNGEFAFWIGSAISRERYPALAELIQQLLGEVHRRADFSQPACPWRRCLKRILELIEEDLDPARESQAPANWLGIGDLAWRLVNHYSDVLQQSVFDGQEYSLAIDVLKIGEIYAKASVEPDAEHRLLACLIEEGIVSQMVSANWDPLIEQAHDAARDRRPNQLQVVVRPLDIDGSRTARLVKIHGCAKRLAANVDDWRTFIVATRVEIQKWTANANGAVQELTRTLLRQSPTLFLGLSVQDWNLQVEVLKAFASFDPPLNPDPPRVLFAEESLKLPQRTVLTHIHGTGYAQQPDEVERRATLQLYGKPLLGTLFVLTLLKKAEIIVSADGDVPLKHWESFLHDSIEDWSVFLGERYDPLANPLDTGRLWRTLTEEVAQVVARFMRVFREYSIPNSGAGYYAVHNESVAAFEQRMRGDVGLRHGSVLLLLGALLRGHRDGQWELQRAAGTDGKHGQFSVMLCGHRVSVFVAPDAGTGLQTLQKKSYIDAANGLPVVVAYSKPRASARGQHSPARSLRGRSRSSARPAEIWLHELAAGSSTPTALVDDLRHRMVDAL